MTGVDISRKMLDVAQPKQVYEKVIGRQVNMASSSWDSTRIYYTSSLLANWDKVEAAEGEDLQYFKAYAWNDGALEHAFTVDFLAEKLGTPSASSSATDC